MITVKFTCDECGLKDHEVQVPARDTPDIDVNFWMHNVVARCVGEEHGRLSPKCRAHHLTNLKIPAPKEAEFIGQQIE